MIRIRNLKHCSGCMACLRACQSSAITTYYENGFAYPRADSRKCIDCGRCEAVCPYLHSMSTSVVEGAYIAYTEESLRQYSSAGGVFAVLALRTLASGGAVFGAAYNDDGTCSHRCIVDADELFALMGRKYVESEIGDCYARAKELLLEERDVLFSGTPCQIAGLKRYLGAPYPRLLTVEVGCGGVAGEDVWNSFLSLMGDPVKVEITNRADDDNRAAIRFVYEDGLEKILSRKDTEIHKAITQGLGIRPSCENCAMGRKKSAADITLRRYNPALDDNALNIRRQPMTMALCRTAAGRRALAESASLLTVREISREDAYRHMNRAEKEKRFAERSGAFIKSLAVMPFDEALDKYSRRSLVDRIAKAVRSLFVK